MNIPEIDLPELDSIRPGCRWSAVSSSGQALLISRLLQKNRGRILVICRDEAAVAQLVSALNFFRGDDGVQLLVFPDRQTLPYDALETQYEITSERLRTLSQLMSAGKQLVIASVCALLHRLPPPQWLYGNSFEINTGERLLLTDFCARLSDAGYRRVELVEQPSEYAGRGGIVDLFPAGTELPLRLEWLDDTIDSIRWFEPISQRTVNRVERLSLLPAREFPLDPEARRKFARRWRSSFPSECDHSPCFTGLSGTEIPPGSEYYLPLFFTATGTLFDYLGTDTTIISCCDHAVESDHFWDLVRQLGDERSGDLLHPPLPPTELFIERPELEAAISRHPWLQLVSDDMQQSPSAIDIAGLRPLQKLPAGSDFKAAVRTFRQYTQAHGRQLFVLRSAKEALRFKELLQEQAVVDGGWNSFCSSADVLGMARGELGNGFAMPGLALISDSDLSAQTLSPGPPPPRYGKGLPAVGGLESLHDGDLVVHRDYGIGRYRGLTEEAGDDGVREQFVQLQYADGDRLFLPVSELQQLHHYGNLPDAEVSLHSLGSSRWKRELKRARDLAEDFAAEMLQRQARRVLNPLQAWHIPEAEYARFAASFPFAETEDQSTAIADILQDLGSEGAMDRLLCADVGFGKTEVAMRAVFIAVWNGFQSAVLVPTRLLAMQHFDSFSERFADWPIKTAVLTSATTAADYRKIREQLAQGRIDVLIGTHRLLSKSLKFGNLGLLITDEEHRFGVNHKERLKQLREGVNLLSLTATPIPRTLHMALGNLRSLSIMASAPEGRLPIKTSISSWNPVTVRMAVQRELHRGGQVYFIHNRIGSAVKIMQDLQELVPEAKTAVIHSKLARNHQQRVMEDFYHGRINLLVSTTIVESGIDVANANTIIIARADMLGLAQLHQLRGRVGRGNRQAYALLLLPGLASELPDSARRRLQALSQASALGSGFSLASQDLDIRGAGELLGVAQSGRLQRVGLSLYTQLLEAAVAQKQQPGTSSPLLEQEHTLVQLHIEALLPEDWIADVNLRLTLYQRISRAESFEQLEALRLELRDRFGRLPVATENLFRQAELKLRLSRAGIGRISLDSKGGSISFRSDTAIASERIIRLLQDGGFGGYRGQWRMRNQTSIGFMMNLRSAQKRIDFSEDLLNWLLADQ